VLGYPDPHKPFVLDTDASGVGLGAVLSQLDADGNERVIAYYSRSLNSAERKYSVTKLELLSLVSAVKHFRPYLYGTPFTVRTDHHSLIWLTRLKAPSGILARWFETLSEYHYDIKHRPGKYHSNADGLSRRFEQGEVIVTKTNNQPGGQIKATDSFEKPIATETSQTSEVVQVSQVSLKSSMQTELKIKQQSDDDLKIVLQAVNKGELPDGNTLKVESLATRHYWQAAHQTL
jgi:hypothetical protein